MKSILGIDVDIFPISGLSKIGDLVYYDGPITSVFSSKHNEAYIYDWVDSNDEVNRWLVYQINISALKMFIEGKLSHLNFIYSAQNSVFIVDIDNECNIKKCKISNLNAIPSDYLPEKEVFFDEELCPDKETIFTHFKLDEIDVDINNIKSNEIIVESEKIESEITNLHLNLSDKVSFGHIETATLGKILTKYQELSNSIALCLFHKPIYDDNGKLNYKSKQEQTDILKSVNTEFAFSKAASFSAFLVPKVKIVQENLFNTKTKIQLVFENLLELFKIDENNEQFEIIKNKYNKRVLKSFKDLLSEIRNDNLNIDFNWADYHTKQAMSKNIDKFKAIKVLKFLSDEFLNEPEKIIRKGYFKAIDRTNSAFKFVSINEDVLYRGKFSQELTLELYKLNFEDEYEIEIKRVSSNKQDSYDLIIKDTIVNWVKIEPATS